MPGHAGHMSYKVSGERRTADGAEVSASQWPKVAERTLCHCTAKVYWEQLAFLSAFLMPNFSHESLYTSNHIDLICLFLGLDIFLVSNVTQWKLNTKV